MHITVAYSRSNKSRSGLGVHLNRFEPDDVVDIDGLGDGDKLAAFACLDEVPAGLSAGQNRELRSDITQRLCARDDRRGVTKTHILVDLATGKPNSPPESMFRLLGVRRDSRSRKRNTRFSRSMGCCVLDIAWPTVRIALQYDGYAAHDERNKRDSERDGRMAGRGRITVRATAADLSDPSRVVDDLRAASR